MSAPADQLTVSRAVLRITRGGGQAERRSTGSYLIHQAIADLFGDRADRGYLYRVTADYPGGAEVLVLSHAPPLAAAGLSSPEHRRVQRVQSKRFDPHLTPGQLLDFEIRINATQVVTTEKDGRVKKQRTDAWEAVWQADKQTPRTPHEVYGEYLQRKLQGAAELLPDAGGALARVTERGEVQARRGNQPKPIRFVAANLIGSLRVEDPEQFLDIVVRGIGRAKAFGCGLLCLSRPGSVLARRYPEGAAGLL